MTNSIYSGNGGMALRSWTVNFAFPRPNQLYLRLDALLHLGQSFIKDLHQFIDLFSSDYQRRA